MASEVEICNRALQKLGASRINTLSENTANARACNAAYEPVRDAELRAHSWNFAIERAALAADATAPSWGRTNSFTLPAAFLRLLNPYPEDDTNSRDWQIESGKILTDDAAPLYIRYIKKVTDTNAMDPLFREALASKLAMEMCEKITQSNSKKAAASDDYKHAIREARRVNAIENVPTTPVEDTFITCRV